MKKIMFLLKFLAVGFCNTLLNLIRISIKCSSAGSWTISTSTDLKSRHNIKISQKTLFHFQFKRIPRIWILTKNFIVDRLSGKINSFWSSGQLNKGVFATDSRINLRCIEPSYIVVYNWNSIKLTDWVSVWI